MPFGGFGSVLPPVASLSQGFASYQFKAKDPKTFYLDLGPDAAKGVTGFGLGPTIEK